MLSCVIVRI